MLAVNILKEFDSLPLLKTSVDNGAEENDMLWLKDAFACVSLDDITCADANITYYVSGYAVQHYTVILSTIESTKTKFLSMSNPRSVFLKASINIVATTKTLSNLLFQ